MNNKIAKYQITDKIDLSFSLDREYDLTFNEYGKSHYVETEAIKSVSAIVDSEKVQYYPIQTDEIIFYIKQNDAQKFYSEFGFIQDDVDVFSNRFKNTQLRIHFFDSPVPSNQSLIYELNLNTQGNKYQRDSDGDLLNVGMLPLVFNIETPFKNIKNKKNSLGYGIPFFKNPINYSLPLKIYAAFFLLNALNGKIYRLYSSNIPLNVSNLYQYLYITYTLNMLNGKYFYTVDSTDRLITTVGLKKEITLNILNVS